MSVDYVISMSDILITYCLRNGNIMVWKLNFSDEVYIYTILWAGNWSLMSELLYIMYVIKLIHITPLQYVDNIKTLLVMTWIFECRLVLLLWQWVVSIWPLLQSKNELLPFVDLKFNYHFHLIKMNCFPLQASNLNR